MINFKEHDGLLFKMLEEPVPLRENDENVLVRFITHGVIGEYVMEHWLDCNQKNVPIYVEGVDSDGDVTVWIDDVHHCCPFPMFEIIGTFVKEGSADWALYQMMQGNKVRNRDWDGGLHEKSLLYCQLIGETIKHNEGCSALDVCLSDWEAPYIKNTGWQIYKEPKPKPLLADAQVGDLCKHRNGEWSQIIDTNETYIPGQPIRTTLKDSEGINRNFCLSGSHFTMQFGGEYDIVHTEPLAPKGSVDWAWQMLKLGVPVSHPAEGKIQDTDYTKERFVRCMAKTGWQLYTKPKEEQQPTKEPIANCKYCKHVCTNSNVDHCHMYEPKPESENIIHGHIPADMHLKYIHLFKVGDWVECKDLAGVPAQCKVLEIRKHNVILECTTGHIWSLPHNNIIRKLSPSEIIVTIGCLSGTIAKSCDPNYFLMLHSRPATDCNHSMIRFSAIDTETRSLVESLLKAQKEEE